MNKISRVLDAAKSKLYYSQPVYVPGYTYSPWKPWIVLVLLALVSSLIVFGYIRSNTSQERKISDASVLANVKAPLPSSNTTEHAPKSAIFYTVDRVIDGDTIDISLDGKVERIRLIGVDTPESVDPRKTVQCFGTEASNFTKNMLTGKKVSIESDGSQGDRDKYSRLLRYVYLPDGTNVNKDIIAKGYGHEYTYNVPYKYQDQFNEAEQLARNNNAGLWSPNTCNGNTDNAAAASATPKAVATTTTASSNCDPNYSPCIRVSQSDLDCSDIGFSVRVIGRDIHRLDREGDGTGCESY